MTEPSVPDHARTIRETTNCALAALDVLIRKLNLDAGDPMAAILEVQREVILSLGRLSETVAEVAEVQNDVLKSPEMRDAMRQAAEMGAEAGFQQVAGEMRRRTWLHSCILVAGMVVGGIAGVTGFAMGSNHALSTMVADCLQKGAQLTSGGDRGCAVLMSPR